MAPNRTPPQAAWILLLVVMVPQLGLTLANPSNTAIAGELGTSVAAVEATLTVYMVGYAVSMFVSGTLADRFDATRLQAVGLGLFAAGFVLAALAPTVAFLGFSRFLQALGGTSTTVLCRIIVQRRYPANRRISLLTSMSMVISLTPSLSPLVGGLAAQVLDWRALFLVLAVFAVALVPADAHARRGRGGQPAPALAASVLRGHRPGAHEREFPLVRGRDIAGVDDLLRVRQLLDDDPAGPDGAVAGGLRGADGRAGARVSLGQHAG
ncbi:MFS transporter [Corynebacterium frankenforstense]|uniref:MFS transporter n=1 Tax=Corynebacterium frankenforstense TaxID=1230998 RepID=UPI0025501412|nr:MFS transporter [Corynebacterium frankenforstense]MDK6260533.1 MFS transporter [Corynebacterium frankenforstense]